MPSRNIFLNVTEDERSGLRPMDGFLFLYERMYGARSLVISYGTDI
jgi:hypothetical protein